MTTKEVSMNSEDVAAGSAPPNVRTAVRSWRSAASTTVTSASPR